MVELFAAEGRASADLLILYIADFNEGLKKRLQLLLSNM